MTLWAKTDTTADKLYDSKLVLAGLLAGYMASEFFSWSGLVHEFGHLIAAFLSGGTGRLVSWTEVVIYPLTTFTTISGYTVDVLFIAGLLALTARKRWPMGFAFMFASWWQVYLESFISKDFNYLRMAGADTAILVYGIAMPVVSVALLLIGYKRDRTE